MTELQRFVDAQEPIYAQVVAELAAGRKRTHWMWFVFPQLRLLGRSSTAAFYGLEDLDEARAYFAHPVLGIRLRDCVETVLSTHGRTAHEIFGSPDDLKFKSCLTLFERAAPAERCFPAALERFYGGERDPKTSALLET